MFTTKGMLRQKAIQLAVNEGLRFRLGENLKRYLDHVICWEVLARQYNEAYELANESARTGHPVVLDLEF